VQSRPSSAQAASHITSGWLCALIASSKRFNLTIFTGAALRQPAVQVALAVFSWLVPLRSTKTASARWVTPPPDAPVWARSEIASRR